MASNGEVVCGGSQNPVSRPRFSIAELLWLTTVAGVAFGLFFYVYPFGPLLAWFALTAQGFAVATRFQSSLFQIGFALLIVLGVFTIPYFLIDGHSVSPYALDRIEFGFSDSTVESILGKPTQISEQPSGTEWLYSGPTWCHVAITFNKEGRVNRIEHDH